MTLQVSTFLAGFGNNLFVLSCWCGSGAGDTGLFAVGGTAAAAPVSR